MPGQKNRKLDPFFEQESPGQTILAALRDLCLTAELDEEIKWRHPCYTHNDQNVCILGSLRQSISISFFLGAMLDDPNQLLKHPGPNTRAGKVVLLDSLADLERSQGAIAHLLNQAKTLAEKSVRFDYEESRETEAYPQALQAALSAEPALRQAWEALTPGRRRAWLIHFGSAKQSKTVVSRIEKATSKIIAGKGWNER